MSATQKSKSLSFTVRTANFAFKVIVHLWPADTRDWARAMQAEAAEITNTRESLAWLLGGIMSLTKAWRNRVFFGPKNLQLRPTPKLPGIASLAFLLIALASLALPVMRQGLSTVVATWRSSDGELTEAELRQFGAQAERDSDARTLAFVSLRLPVDEETTRWADRAVVIDPSLTWIYYQMDRHPFPGYELNDADFVPRAARLQQWDPDNAAPYLAGAERLFNRAGWEAGWYDFGLSAELKKKADAYADAALAFANDHPDWAHAMDRAVRAQRFDDYSSRIYALNVAVLREHKIHRPVELFYSAWARRVPSIQNIGVYANARIRQAQALESSDVSSAAAQYWQVANFAQMMKAGVGEAPFEQRNTLGIIAKSFTALQPLLQKEGRADEARYAAYEIQLSNAEAQSIRMNYFASEWERKNAAWSSLMIHASAALLLLTGALSLFSFLWVALTYRSDSKSAGRSWLLRAARCSPIILVFSAALFYTSYFPLARMIKEASPDNLRRLSLTYAGMLSVPYNLNSNGHVPVWFWASVSVLGVGIVMLMLVRMTLRANTDRHAAA
jgi:hypothetical protein